MEWLDNIYIEINRDSDEGKLIDATLHLVKRYFKEKYYDLDIEVMYDFQYKMYLKINGITKLTYVKVETLSYFNLRDVILVFIRNLDDDSMKNIYLQYKLEKFLQ